MRYIGKTLTICDGDKLVGVRLGPFEVQRDDSHYASTGMSDIPRSHYELVTEVDVTDTEGGTRQERVTLRLGGPLFADFVNRLIQLKSGDGY